MAAKRKTSGREPLRIHPSRAKALAGRLSAWFAEVKRDLPWRRRSDPYGIWLAEVMTQQTRVDTVVPYYEKFLERFPTVDDLAAAPLDDVLSLWAGLGYYSRARSLHAAARKVVSHFGGKFPESAEELRKLPGVGPYTSGSVASVAFDRPEPAVDGNVVRSLSRLEAWDADTASAADRKAAEPAARDLLSRGSPRILTQAIMELGATICSPARPQCERCPVDILCRAKQQDRVGEFPRRSPRARPKPVRHVALALTDPEGRVLVRRRDAGDGLFAGLWGLPGAELSAKRRPTDLATRIAEEIGVAGEPFLVGRVEHTLTHRRMRVELFRLWAGKPGNGTGRWIDPADPGEIALSTLQRKLLALLTRSSDELL